MISCCILASWGLFSYFTFGKLISNSVHVKIAQGGLSAWQDVTYFGDLRRRGSFPSIAWPLAVCGVLTFISSNTRGRILPLILTVLFGFIQFAVYSIGHAPAGYFWYHIPTLLSLNLLAVLGLLEGLRYAALTITPKKLMPYSNSSPSWVKIIFGITIGICVSFFGFDSPETFAFKYRLSDEYTQIGNWLNQNASHKDMVAASEIGYLGYYSNLQVLDMHALIHPRVNARRRASGTWWLETNLPNYIVVHSPPWWGEPSEDWIGKLRIKLDKYGEVFSQDSVHLLALKGEGNK